MSYPGSTGAECLRILVSSLLNREGAKVLVAAAVRPQQEFQLFISRLENCCYTEWEATHSSARKIKSSALSTRILVPACKTKITQILNNEQTKRLILQIVS